MIWRIGRSIIGFWLGWCWKADGAQFASFTERRIADAAGAFLMRQKATMELGDGTERKSRR